MPEPLVILERVTKRYGAGEVAVYALRDVSLRLPPGEFVVFLGPSGSGKTTLLNILGGLERPTSGRVIVAGHDLTAMSEAALTTFRREVVGFIFQFFNLIPTLTARENVELIAGLSQRPMDVRQALAAVELSDRMDHFPAALSGGEQQRVAIARALVKQPALILADEPTGSLDYDTGVRVLAAMRETTRGTGQSVFLVTHNQEIARMADRIVRLHSGQVAEEIVNPNPVSARELEW